MQISHEILQKPLLTMTGSEILELFQVIADSKTVTHDFSEKKYVHGLRGLATLLGVSKTTAQKIKNEGKIDAAIYQTGKTIVIDSEKALQLLQNPS